jgi:intergrase/recombinase
VLSKIEREFLEAPERFDANYSRVLRSRLRAKAARLRGELGLLEAKGLGIREDCNGIRESRNGEKPVNCVAFGEPWWTEGDLNPRPPECKWQLPQNGELAMDWAAFRKWAENQYSRKYAISVCNCALRYQHIFNRSLSELNAFQKAKKRMILAALIALSKYQGSYDAFKRKMGNFGVIWDNQRGFEIFLRILNDNSHDVLSWVRDCTENFDLTYSTFIKFALITGLRKGEAFQAFNLVVKLSKEGKVGEIYNSELETLELHKYPKIFFRRGKNAFFSFIPEGFMKEMTKCNVISDSGLKRRLRKNGLTCKLKELRHYQATFMAKHGLLREEADLLQGRISQSVFMRHYVSPSITELKDRVLAAVGNLLNVQEALAPNDACALAD